MNYTNTSSIMTGFNYNLSVLFSSQAIESPENWLAVFNSQLGYWPIFILLILFGVVLFLLFNQRSESSNVESLAGAGYLTTFIGILLLVIEPVSGYKLLSWVQFVPIVVVTAIAFGLHKASKDY